MIFGLLVNPIEAKVYKWTDENGKTHYTDNEGKIPKQYKEQNMEMYKSKDTSVESVKKYVCKIQPGPQADREIKDQLLSIHSLERQIAESEESKYYRTKRSGGLADSRYSDAAIKIKEEYAECRSDYYKRKRRAYKLRRRFIEDPNACYNKKTLDLSKAKDSTVLQKNRATHNLKKSQETIQGYREELNERRYKLRMEYAKYRCEET